MSTSNYMTKLNYTDLIGWRNECFLRFRSVLNLPIAENIYAECRRFYQGGRVLDVGAGVAKTLKKALSMGNEDYYSLDSDPQGEFNFSSFAEIPSEMKFDLVVMNQVLEHLTVDDSYTLLVSAGEILNSRGRLFISVPNAEHPVRFHSHVTHITNWNFFDLHGLLKYCGYEVINVLRCNKKPPSRNVVKRWIVNVVCREFRMDWCDSIIVEAEKP